MSEPQNKGSAYSADDFLKPQKQGCRWCGETEFHLDTCDRVPFSVSNLSSPIAVLDSERIQTDRCPLCGHAPHRAGVCLNMASDNDCHCGESLLDQPVAPETIYIQHYDVDRRTEGNWYTIPPTNHVEYRRVKTCKWLCNDESIWTSGCGKGYGLSSDVSYFKFCGFCGGRIEIA